MDGDEYEWISSLFHLESLHGFLLGEPCSAGITSISASFLYNKIIQHHSVVWNFRMLRVSSGL